MKIKREETDKAYKILCNLPYYQTSGDCTLFFPIEKVEDIATKDDNGFIMPAVKLTGYKGQLKPGFKLVTEINEDDSSDHIVIVEFSYASIDDGIDFDLKEYLKLQGYKVKINQKDLDWIQSKDCLIIPKQSCHISLVYQDLK